MSMNVEMTDSSERLMSDVEVLDEDHDGRFDSVSLRPLRFEDWIDVFEIKFEIVLSGRHLVSNSLHRYSDTSVDATRGTENGLTERRIVVGNRRIRSNSLVLTVDENPQSNILRCVSILLGDLGSEFEERLSFLDSVTR